MGSKDKALPQQQLPRQLPTATTFPSLLAVRVVGEIYTKTYRCSADNQLDRGVDLPSSCKLRRSVPARLEIIAVTARAAWQVTLGPRC